jgi:hypothetical protein
MDKELMADILGCANATLVAFRLPDKELDYLEESGTPEETERLFLLRRVVHGAAPSLLDLITKLSAMLRLQTAEHRGTLN